MKTNLLTKRSLFTVAFTLLTLAVTTSLFSQDMTSEKEFDNVIEYITNCPDTVIGNKNVAIIDVAFVKDMVSTPEIVRIIMDDTASRISIMPAEPVLPTLPVLSIPLMDSSYYPIQVVRAVNYNSRL